MAALWWSAVGAGLAGSLHCAAMCGPLVFAAAARRPIALALHQAGRACGYVALGAMAGAIGDAVDAGAVTLGIQRGALWIAAAALAAFGVAQLALHAGARFDLVRACLAPLHRLAAPVRSTLGRASPRARAFVLGALSGLLPCGLLWAFVLVAAGTGEAIAGAGVMLAFFAGTLPALVVTGTCAGLLQRRLDARVPRFAVAVLAIASLWAVLHRAGAYERVRDAVPRGGVDAASVAPACCDGS